MELISILASRGRVCPRSLPFRTTGLNWSHLSQTLIYKPWVNASGFAVWWNPHLGYVWKTSTNKAHLRAFAFAIAIVSSIHLIYP